MKFFDNVGQATATTGTGTITLGAVLGSNFHTFAEQGALDGDQVYYRIDEGGDVEIGIGTLGTSVSELSRDTVLSSRISGTAGTSKMTLAGGAEVQCVAASDAMHDAPERGSNANGEYVRFSDGTQICWLNNFVANYLSNSLCVSTWTYPAAFSSVPTVQIQFRDAADATPTQGEIGQTRPNNETLTNTDIQVMRVLGQTDFQSGDFVKAHVIAHGRWF